MDEKRVLTLLVLHLLNYATAVFFHEPSSVILKPETGQNHTDFGFSLAYQGVRNNLVVGAPSVDPFGKVYSCETNDAGSLTKIRCTEYDVDFESLADYSRKINPDQYFYLGGSIVATDDDIFTCAPLMTANLRTLTKVLPDAYGTCFVINENGTDRYVGLLERYLKKKFTTNLLPISGGTGWSTLVDEENDLLIIGKTTLFGDFLYTTSSNPLKPVKSIWTKPTKYSSGDPDLAAMSIFHTKYNNLGIGMTAGKLFSNTTVYAFSMEHMDMSGAISFLEYAPKQKQLSVMYRDDKPYILENKFVNTMFGSAMWATDLNMDGLDELVVGAPTYSEEDCAECGAVYIYMGGDKDTMDDRDRLRTILSSKVLSRFGSAISSADIDGDSIPELVIAAPYEDDYTGAVYILSGYEVHHTLAKFQTYRVIQLASMKLTQRIQKKSFRSLGYSLQFINDADDNGCNELSAGSPGNGTVLVFKCIRHINVTVSSQLIGEKIVREQDKNFTVQVCVQVDTVRTNTLPIDIVGNINVTNTIMGEATYIPKPQFAIDISCNNCSRNKQFCENVTVFLNDNDARDYLFISKAELNVDYIFNSTEFNKTWVVASPYSKLEKRLDISRHCKGDDCIPKLDIEILWSGKRNYVLGSSRNERVKIRVRNDGNASYESCVWVKVTGAPVQRVGCVASEGGYQCYLPKPLRRNSEYFIELGLNMTRPTNLHKDLWIHALLYENCNQKIVTRERYAYVPYVFTTDDVYVVSSSRYTNITEKQITSSEYIQDSQEYQIVNNGSITWHNIQTVVTMEKKPFILSYEVSASGSGKCKEQFNPIDAISYVCELTIMPNSTQKIIGTTKLLGNKIEENLYEEKLNMTSKLVLHLLKTSESTIYKYGNSTSTLHFQTDVSFGSNMWYIALLVILLAILIMAIVIFVLYKQGFFRRKQKQRLEVLRRESIKRRNSVSSVELRTLRDVESAASTISTERPRKRRSTYVSDRNETNNEPEGLQIDVVDDEDPFDEIPVTETAADNASLVNK